jgi:hypothetical protein
MALTKKASSTDANYFLDNDQQKEDEIFLRAVHDDNAGRRPISGSILRKLKLATELLGKKPSTTPAIIPAPTTPHKMEEHSKKSSDRFVHHPAISHDDVPVAGPPPALPSSNFAAEAAPARAFSPLPEEPDAIDDAFLMLEKQRQEALEKSRQEKAEADRIRVLLAQRRLEKARLKNDHGTLNIYVNKCTGLRMPRELLDPAQQWFFRVVITLYDTEEPDSAVRLFENLLLWAFPL